jgi:hypothetical protein
LAGTIAGYILRWRFFLVTGLNKHFNRRSKKNQQWLLFLFCLATTGTLLLCLTGHLGRIGMKTGATYGPGHIGQSSGPPLLINREQTDSITSKK